MEKIRQYINHKTVIMTAMLLCIAIAIITVLRFQAFAYFSMEIDLDEMSGSMEIDDDGSRYLQDGNSGYVLYGPYMTI